MLRYGIFGFFEAAPSLTSFQREFHLFVLYLSSVRSVQRQINKSVRIILRVPFNVICHVVPFQCIQVSRIIDDAISRR